MHFSSEISKIRRFPSFLDNERRFFNVCLEKLRRNFFWRKKLELLNFSAFKSKNSNFFSKHFELGVHNCLQPIQIKILRTFSKKDFFLLSICSLTGSLSDYAGKNFGVRENFLPFSQSLSAGVSELTTFWPFKQLETSEENGESQRNNLGKFSKVLNILKPCRTESEKFSVFLLKILGGSFKADFHLSREDIWRKNAFLKDFGTLTKSSWAI